ncbi:hypothetical protein DNTS_018611 [Danionella cerebrum]|uniref:Proline-rich transmembrane protein 1 n=1 Tax=Danionella cerebrum TaxID=2873325 RepID=A0A553NIY2_9TELE|nr:hypothetical protein DNTS_018611 [Danionella translucida]
MEPQDDWNSTEKTKLLPNEPPPYQHPSALAPPGGFPGPSGYQGQQFGPQMVTVQPTVYLTSLPLAYPLPDYMAYSIFTMICCCLPLGVAALIYSINTRNANMSGQQQQAEINSKMARILNHTALGIGLALLVFYITYVIVVVTTVH